MNIDETRDIKTSERPGSKTQAISVGLVLGIIIVALTSVAIIFGLRVIKSSVIPFVAELSSWMTFLVGLGVGVGVGALLADRFAKLGGWKE
jgi:predicted transporter